MNTELTESQAYSKDRCENAVKVLRDIGYPCVVWTSQSGTRFGVTIDWQAAENLISVAQAKRELAKWGEGGMDYEAPIQALRDLLTAIEPYAELPDPTNCPTCGSPVRVVSGGEGTNHYEPDFSLLRQTRLRESIASVALSHDEACTCDTCKAAHGDEGAFVRVVDRLNRASGE